MQNLFSKKFILGLLFISYSTEYLAQVSKLMFLPCTGEILKSNHQALFFYPVHPSAHTINNSFYGLTPTNQKPMFCRMEDNLHKRFNVWIVLRAGSDEQYKKLISEENKPKHENTP